MNDQHPVSIEGGLAIATDARVAVVASRFNELIVEQLVSGALVTLQRHGVSAERITLVRVPGAWELPAVCKRLAHGGQVQGIVALGCVIRGGTPHFDFVAGEAARGLAQVAADSGIPLGFGVITANTLQQALERVDESKVGHRGVEAALATLHMISLYQALGRARL